MKKPSNSLKIKYLILKRPAPIAVGMAGLAALGLGTAAFRPAGGTPEPGGAIRVLPVETEPVEISRGYGVSHRFVGRVEAPRASELGFEIEGLLASVLVDEGQAVIAGEVLARLDTARLESRRRELTAALEEAESARALAESSRSRVEKALLSNAVSEQQFDEADQNARSKAAAARRIGAQIESIDVELDKSIQRAPFDGVIVARRADEGEVVGAGAPILRILDSGRQEVRVGVSAGPAKNLSVGEQLDVESGGRRYPAGVKAIVPTRSGNTRTIDIVLVLLEKASDLFDGDLVEVALRKEYDETGFWLSRSALTEAGRGLWTAYVAKELAPQGNEKGATHRLERRNLDLVHQEGDRVFARGALAEGEQVVTRGMHRLVPGQLVAVRKGREFHVGMTKLPTARTGEVAN